MKNQTKIEKVISNFFNGNITDAKKKGKRFSRASITACAKESFGYESEKAWAISSFLKGDMKFEEYCTIMAKY